MAQPPRPVVSIPNFVGQYYETSTFHHLSRWKAQYQRLTSQLAAVPPPGAAARALNDSGSVEKDREGHDEASHSTDSSFSSDDTPALPLAAVPPASRIIIHIDMDCFYVSVALRARPDLRGKPVVVCPSVHASGHSEVASASYEARQTGIRARMLLRDARALCPDLVCLPCDFDQIEDASARLYEQLLQYSHSLEATSADEAYLDVSQWTWENAEASAKQLKAAVEAHTGCPSSVGLGPNKLTARLATIRAKPQGIKIVRPDEVEAFVGTFQVGALPTVGPRTATILAEAGLQEVSQLLTVSLATLQGLLGPKHGQAVFDFARGRDSRPLAMAHERKSLGTQISWGVRFESVAEVSKFLSDLAQELSKRLQQINIKGQRLTLKILKHDPLGVYLATEGNKGESSLDEISNPAKKAPIKGTESKKPTVPGRRGPSPPQGTAPSATSQLSLNMAVIPQESRKPLNPGPYTPCTRSVRLGLATHDPLVIAAEGLKLFHPMKIAVTEVRGVGLSMDGLQDASKTAGAQRTLSQFFKSAPPPSARSTQAPASQQAKGESAPSQLVVLDESPPASAATASTWPSPFAMPAPFATPVTPAAGPRKRKRTGPMDAFVRATDDAEVAALVESSHAVPPPAKRPKLEQTPQAPSKRAPASAKRPAKSTGSLKQRSINSFLPPPPR